jgi:peptidyl-dipeptidase A
MLFPFARRAAVALAVFGLQLGSHAAESDELESRARSFITQAEETLIPLKISQGRAWWDASTTGKDEAYQRATEAQNRINVALSDRKVFADLREIHEAVVKREDVDPLVDRQIRLLYLKYLGKQVDPELLKQATELSNTIEKQFNRYRGKIGDTELSDNELNRMLKESTDSTELKQAWEASKGIGSVIESDLLKLVRLRNQIAGLLGFDNYQHMSLTLDEHDPAHLVQLFDELDDLTRDAFREAKADIDRRLAKRLKIKVRELRPWHYQNAFFQRAPDVYDVNLDSLYVDQDIVRLSRDFYRSIGLPCDYVLERSSLFPQDGKSPHAFCIDIDHRGDVRVLANIDTSDRWMSTMLHELGHAVYSSQYYPQELPWFLRDASHTLTTEGLAMMFERQTKVLRWMEQMRLAPEDAAKKRALADVARRTLRNKLLIFSRWAQVMYRFEKSLYENPEQDLNRLWWDLVEKYQMVPRPEGRDAPDYAAKIHIVVAPVYYHNYALGELFASQVHHAMCRDALGGVSPGTVSYTDDKRVGRFVLERVIQPGTTIDWHHLTEHATGEPLSAKAFAADMRE